MVVIPAGSFTMGSPLNEPDRWSGETQVRVSFAAPFAVGKYAVTFDEWDDCARARDPNDQGYVRTAWCTSASDRWGRGKQPVINVNWKEVKDYVAWLSRRSG